MTDEKQDHWRRIRAAWTPKVIAKLLMLLASIAIFVWTMPELHFWEHGWDSLRYLFMLLILLAIFSVPAVRRAVWTIIAFSLMLLGSK